MQTGHWKIQILQTSILRDNMKKKLKSEEECKVFFLLTDGKYL